jgi:L-histidine N-alpha-methyltransferase
LTPIHTADFVTLHVHQSQYPAAVRASLLDSLRSRQVNHKFHYVSYKQASQWVALFNRYSPYVNDPDCRRIYESSFQKVASVVRTGPVQVIGLGCGSGDKDLQLLQLLRNAGPAATYVPVDASVPLVLATYHKVEKAGFSVSAAIVSDIGHPFSWRDVPAELCLVTFFGMIPNFEPKTVWPNLAAMLEPGELLLVSANLAPGEDYEAGLQKVLPQYDNAETAEWLLTFLSDLGVDRGDGELRWRIESDAHYSALRRISAHFEFTRPRAVVVEGVEFSFQAADRIRLFFSYRYGLQQLKGIADEHNLRVQEVWSTTEEAVVLCRRA